jgi:hypothetical protein
MRRQVPAVSIRHSPLAQGQAVVLMGWTFTGQLSYPLFPQSDRKPPGGTS